ASVIGVVVAMVAATVANAQTQKVVQSVVVSVDGNGTVTKIKSSLVTQEGNGKPRTSDREHDPAKTASKLPLFAFANLRQTVRSWAIFSPKCTLTLQFAWPTPIFPIFENLS
ncbi:MAG TPA: hypothetical protein PKL15_20825, partial [Saprospiraceae bacterium]|nr:hypothetical protein [Saprospiraceae bacterium]